MKVGYSKKNQFSALAFGLMLGFASTFAMAGKDCEEWDYDQECKDPVQTQVDDPSGINAAGAGTINYGGAPQGSSGSSGNGAPPSSQYGEFNSAPPGADPVRAYSPRTPILEDDYDQFREESVDGLGRPIVHTWITDGKAGWPNSPPLAGTEECWDYYTDWPTPNEHHHECSIIQAP